MVKKPILKTSVLRAELGEHFMLWDSDFRIGRVNTIRASELPENIHITTMLPEQIGTNAVSSADHRVVELKPLRDAGRSNRFMLIPKKLLSSIDVDSLIEVAIRVSERVMPGRWWYSTGYMYYYYPELTLKNSLGLNHTVYDLVVKITLGDFTFNETIQGIRFSFSHKELIASYAHSHLPGMVGFGSFCTGSGSKFKALLTNMKDEFTDLKYEMFLMQLEHYLTWESVEGKPHKYIVELTGKQSAQTNISIGSDSIQYFTDALLMYMPIELITTLNNAPVFDPGLDYTAYSNLEQQAVNYYLITVRASLRGMIMDYDLNSGTYVSSASTAALPNYNSDYNEIRSVFKITPRLIQEVVDPSQSVNIIKRPVPGLLTAAITKVNQILLRHNKFK